MGITSEAVGSLVGGVMSGLDDLFTSDEEREVLKNKREKMHIKLTEVLNQPHILQAMTNIEEAKHPSVFVSGWRPALGWLCVFCLGYAWIIRDAVIIAMGVFNHADLIEKMPVIDGGEMMTLVLALLGLGGIRSYEKIKGAARSSWGTK